MTMTLGEELALEWDMEDRPDLLWEILENLSENPKIALEDLVEFADAGSRLAMAYLGEIYADGLYHADENLDLAEDWLLRSKNQGSREGAFRLAKLLDFKGRSDEALSCYEELSNEGFAPAMYALAVKLWRKGDDGYSKDRAMEYLEKAEKEGHILAKFLMVKLMIRGHYGFFNRILGIWGALKLIVPAIRFSSNYPESDFLRG